MKNSNNYQQQKLRGLKRKFEAVKSRGGKCERCGYDKNLAALDFHHRDPKTKSFKLDMRSFSNLNLETIEEELNKCDLLCANCHREEHHPDLVIKNLSSRLNDCNKKSFSNRKKTSGGVCPVCGNKFPKVSGKIYCSKECREADKNYPSLQEIENQYKIFNSWSKVAHYFGVSRKIIQKIRKSNS